MIIIWGTQNYGQTDYIPDVHVHVSTQFFHLWYIPLFPIQFDVMQGEHVLASVDRIMKIRDSYRVEVQDDAFDWRVAAAVAVAVDAFMNR